MRIISLFSGAGGLDLGLIQAGNTVIWANDIDKDAVATYKENIGEHIVCDDIKNIDISTLPDCDVVVGGFPCQGFSQADMLRTLDDDRNQLYRFFYNTIKIKQPNILNLLPSILNNLLPIITPIKHIINVINIIIKLL